MSAMTETYYSIQTLILSVLECDLGRLSEKAREFARLLELVCPGNFLRGVSAWTGRPARDRARILNALFLKSVENLPSTRSLPGLLRGDSSLRRLCGWDFAWTSRRRRPSRGRSPSSRSPACWTRCTARWSGKPARTGWRGMWASIRRR